MKVGSLVCNVCKIFWVPVFTFWYGESDCIPAHVLRSAGVVPGVLQPGLADGEPGHGGVGRGHPQGVAVLAQHHSHHTHPGLEVDHVVVVVPEDVLRGHHGVPQLAADGHAVPEVDVLLPGAEDGGGGFVDPQPGGESLHSGPGGCLVTQPESAQSYNQFIYSGQLNRPFTVGTEIQKCSNTFRN